MSIQGIITDYLMAQAEGQFDTRVDMTPEQIALGAQVSRSHVNKTMNNLSTRKRLRLYRGDNGRSIVGYSMLEPPDDRRRRPAEAVPFQPKQRTEARPRPISRPRLVYTPMLDAYAEAKQKFEQMRSELGDHIEARFKEDSVAEEGLALKERLTLVEASLSEYRERAEVAERDAAVLRGRHKQAVAAAAADAMVQHSAD